MRPKLLVCDPGTLKVDPAPELLTIREFKELVRRDRSEYKNRAVKELAYIYHFHDPRSAYRHLDPDARHKELAQMYFEEGWAPDKDVRAAAEKYLELTMSPLERLLDAAIEAVSNLENFYRKHDVMGADDPALSASRVIASMSKMGEVAKALQDLREQIAREEEVTGAKIRKGVQLNKFNE